MIKPDPKFLEFFIIFFSVGIIGLIQGRFKSWWGAGINRNAGLILMISFIIISLFFLYLFLKWITSIKLDKLIISLVIKILLLWISLMMLGLLNYFNIFTFPSIINIILVISYFVFIEYKLKEISNTTMKKE